MVIPFFEVIMGVDHYVVFHESFEKFVVIEVIVSYFSMLFGLLFQVVFTGGRTQLRTTKPDEGERHNLSILDFEAQET